jgi:membrane associated rhomboid family serine protease
VAKARVRVVPAHPFAAAATMLALTGLLYVVEFYDTASGHALDTEDGIVPRDPGHLAGVLFAPLLHVGWWHLETNTVGFLIFGFLAMAGGLRQFVAVTALIWLTSGLGVWLIGPPGTVTVGASGIILGWLTFLLCRGFFARSGRQIALAVVLFLIWGGVLWAVLPGLPGVSWQAHLFGALGGLLAARLVASADAHAAVASR